MTAAHFLRGLGKVGVVPALGLLLLARTAGAADDECSGTWRLQVASPEPEKDAWMSPQSWCRAQHLPRTLVVEIGRDDNGRLVMTGEPLQPTDVMHWAGHCEFQFSGVEGGVAKDHELSVDVNREGAVVLGTARCSEWGPTAEGKRTGQSISVAVTGSRSASTGSLPAGHDHVVAAVMAACRQRDADALWKTFTPRFRSEVDQRAAELRRALSAAELRRIYAHRGRPQAFTGLAWLRHSVRMAHSPDNPCSGAEQWKVGPASASANGWLVVIHRGEGFAFGLRLKRTEGAWQLDQITKSTLVDEP